MGSRPALPRTNPIVAAAAAGLAAVACVVCLSTVVNLFLAGGTPMERLVVAERSCSTHRYISEREECVRQWLVAADNQRIAGKED